VGSRSSALLDGAGLLFFGNRTPGDYHGEMCSDISLKLLENQILNRIRGGTLEVDRAPYHLLLTDETRQ